MRDIECNKVIKKSNDEWHEEEAPVALCSLFNNSLSFDDHNLYEFADASYH